MTVTPEGAASASGSPWLDIEPLLHSEQEVVVPTQATCVGTPRGLPRQSCWTRVGSDGAFFQGSLCPSRHGVPP